VTNLALGPIGIATRLDSSPASLAAAATAEELGHPSLWLAGGPLSGLQTVVDVIQATNTLKVAFSPDEIGNPDDRLVDAVTAWALRRRSRNASTSSARPAPTMWRSRC
jgi:hypothetical protein